MELIGGHKVLLLDSRPDSVALAKDIATARTKNNNNEAFVVFNLDSVMDRYALWKRELPMIEPFYAVKCNHDKVLLRTLAALGCGFDCASKKEIKACLEMGVSPDRIIFANPCKTSHSVSYAQEHDVKMMTFDSEEELIKVHQLHPEAEMVLRIGVSDPTAVFQLSVKFGAEPEKEAPQLLKTAQKMGVDVVGISFHVGTGCNDPSAYRQGIKCSAELCKFGRGLGFDMKIIDIGGGFPGGEYKLPFETIADVIRRAINDILSDDKNIRLIAEPGRFFAQEPPSVVVNVIHAKEVPTSRITKNADDAGRGMMYYINDGAFGSFSCVLFELVQPLQYRPLFLRNDETLYPSTIWGPTCDCVDVIAENAMLPKLKIGDWLYFENMGAYSSAIASNFNGMEHPVPIYVISVDSWNKIKSSAHV